MGHLACCVRSLLRTPEPAGIEVAVYGDGGGAASAEGIAASELRLARAGFAVSARYEERNVGITRALNRAVELASGEWLFVVNDDMAFPRTWRERAAALLSPGRVLSTAAVEAPRSGRHMADCCYPLDLGSDPERLDLDRLDAFHEELPLGTLAPGVNYPFFIERSLFLAVGGADERFPGPYHDPDLFLRLKLRGAELVRTPSIAPYHFSGASLRFGEEGAAAKRRSVQSADWIRRENEARLVFVRKWGAKPKTRFGYVPRTPVTAPWEGRAHGPLEALGFRALVAWETLRARVRELRYRR